MELAYSVMTSQASTKAFKKNDRLLAHMQTFGGHYLTMCSEMFFSKENNILVLEDKKSRFFNRSDLVDIVHVIRGMINDSDKVELDSAYTGTCRHCTPSYFHTHTFNHL